MYKKKISPKQFQTFYMDSLAIVLHEIASLEDQLAQKKLEYLNAIRNGVVFDDLKIIFLEVKALQEKVNVSKDLIMVIKKCR